MKTKNLKKLNFIICAITAILLFTGITDVKAAKPNSAWNYDKIIEQTKGAFTYYAYTSTDNTEAWIYKIEINKKKNHKKLSVPKKLDNKKVTRLGFYNRKNEPDCQKNLFDDWAEIWHDADASSPEVNAIKKITLPNTIEVIQPTTFCGMDGITEIAIPDKVTMIADTTFYGCENLDTIYLPKALKKVEAQAFVDCPKLKKIKISSKNKTYKTKKNFLITKKKKELIYAPAGGDILKLPKGIEVIKKYALTNATASVVHIPASVIKIEENAFHKSRYQENATIKDVTVSEQNTVYAKDGQCIYNTKDKSLVIAIVDNNGELYISEKVEKLTPKYSMVNCNLGEENMKIVVFPKNLKTVIYPGFDLVSEADKVYFTGKKPPKMKNVDDFSLHAHAQLPIFTDVYVPEGSYEAYEKWYEKYNDYASVDNFETYKDLDEIIP